jgi:UDP-N-acetylmuramoyl-tripeptide--D-alanyl-D-alanine ligase
MLTALSISVISVAAIVFFSRRLLCYLRHFQEVGYSARLFKDWMLANGIYDKKGSLVATLAALIIEITKESRFNSLIICIVAAIALFGLSWWEPDPRKVGYPILQPTKKATVIYNLALSLYSIAFVLSVIIVHQVSIDDDIAAYWLLVIVAIQSSPLWMIIANAINR